ncbi:hypothetical protein C8J57DRAFT_1329141 [Mycena rebaudengoi]|nr:hypothetical protein C8J57DRAFT_1329141 [Mycena rebaudengoi]
MDPPIVLGGGTGGAGGQGGQTGGAGGTGEGARAVHAENIENFNMFFTSAASCITSTVESICERARHFCHCLFRYRHLHIHHCFHHSHPFYHCHPFCLRYDCCYQRHFYASCHCSLYSTPCPGTTAYHGCPPSGHYSDKTKMSAKTHPEKAATTPARATEGGLKSGDNAGNGCKGPKVRARTSAEEPAKHQEKAATTPARATEGGLKSGDNAGDGCKGPEVQAGTRVEEPAKVGNILAPTVGMSCIGIK